MPCDIILLIVFHMLQFWGGWKGLTVSIPKNATIFGGRKELTLSISKNAIIFWGWKELSLSIPKMVQFWGLERVNPFHPKKCYNFFGL
jgi:hypothetical protein